MVELISLINSVPLNSCQNVLHQDGISLISFDYLQFKTIGAPAQNLQWGLYRITAYLFKTPGQIREHEGGEVVVHGALNKHANVCDT